MGQPHGRHHMDLVHVLLAGEVGVPEPPERPETGVVHEQFKARAIADRAFGGGDALVRRKIGGEHFYMRGVVRAARCRKRSSRRASRIKS